MEFCPECGEICRIKINDYKIKLYECKNKHEIDNISLKENMCCARLVLLYLSANFCILLLLNTLNHSIC